MKKILFIFMILLNVIFLCSCSKAEIDKTAIIESVYVYPDKQGITFEFNTVKNENTSVLPKYTVTSDDIFQAKEKLEKSAVNFLFLGQIECVILSQDLSYNEVSHCFEYFKTAYECSPGVRVLFATNKAMKELKEKEIPITRITELCDLVKSRDNEASVYIYSFYNKIRENQSDNSKVGLLFSQSQLNAKPVAFHSIKTESE